MATIASLLERIEILERVMDKLETALTNAAPKQMINQAIAVRQAELEELKTKLNTLEEELRELQSE